MTGETEAEKAKRFREAGTLMAAGVLISLLGILSFKRLDAMKCFVVSVGGVVAGRGFVRFIFR